MNGTHVYIYENTRAPEREAAIYIGIGNRLRPYEPHNTEATKLRNAATTDVVITREAFSTRSDALRAEAIAIHVASLMGIEVLFDAHDDEMGEMKETHEATRTAVTNRSALKSTTHLGPAIFTRKGQVDFLDLERTCLVTLDPHSIDNRGSLHHGRAPEEIADRARKWWSLGTAVRHDYAPIRLVAVMKAANIILGDWDLVMNEPIIHDDNDDREYNTFNLVDPAKDDPRAVKGKELTGFRGSQQISWSQDISDEHGLKGQRRG